MEAIWLKICAKPPSKFEKRPLPVDVRRSKTLLLKLPNNKALYLSDNVFRTKVLIGETTFTSSTGDGTAILRGHLSQARI